MNNHTKEIAKAWQSLEGQKQNKDIFLDRDALAICAKEHAKDNFEIPNWRFDGIYPKHDFVFATNELWANCFNAHYNVFKKPDTKYMVENPADPSKPFAGAFAMQSVIYKNFGESIILSKSFGMHVKNPRAMAKFFGGIVPMPSPELKQECGKDFFENLESKYYGNPLNLLEEAITGEYRGRRAIRAFNNGKGLVELLVESFGAAYRDTQEIQINGQAHALHFNKRAQLAVVMIHDRALDSKVLPFVEDIDEVGPIADYELPKALRAMGILKYSDELAGLVDNWKEVPKDSQMEIEIRAATVVACLELLKELNSLRAEIFDKNYLLNICHLDYWLWKMGRDAKHLRPHLTRTSAY